MTSSRHKSKKIVNFHLFMRPRPPCGSSGRFRYKTTRSQVLSLKLNYTVNCAVNCCKRVLHTLKFRKTCGGFFAWKTPNSQIFLCGIVWKFENWLRFAFNMIKLQFSPENHEKMTKNGFSRQPLTKLLRPTPILTPIWEWDISQKCL